MIQQPLSREALPRRLQRPEPVPGFDFSSWTHRKWDVPPVVSLRPKEKLHKTPLIERLIAVPILIAISPLLVAVAAAIKISCPRGSIFYRQERVGVDRRQRSSSDGARPWTGTERRRRSGVGRPFLIWKFRTMVPDAEALTGPVWASAKDPRVTRLGRLLRQTRLDEIPQLINVIQGNMRLIGPRPERPEFVRSLARKMPEYVRRLSVPPGITGLAQVEKSYDASMEDVRTKLYYDLFYVEHRCRRLDLKILLKTIDVVVRGRGAR